MNFNCFSHCAVLSKKVLVCEYVVCMFSLMLNVHVYTNEMVSVITYSYTL